MNPEQIAEMKAAMGGVFDELLQQKLQPYIGEVAAMKAREIVDGLRLERSMFGVDKTALSDKQKIDFADVVKASALGMNIDTKANEALIEETDSRGGYLVSVEVANAIMRIAASVGIVMSQAQKWSLKSDELGIPNYTGAFLEGEYLGVDAPGSVTGYNFGSASIIAKKWQLVFVLGNDLVADASVNLADWLLAIGGESLANMVDKQSFVGAGQPFVGLLNHPDVPVYTLATGSTGFDKFNPISDASDVIAQLEESVLDGAAFYCHRTVWAKIRAQKDTAGNFIIPFGGIANSATLQNNPTGGGVKPAGEMLGFPVFTSRHFPAFSASAVSTKFLVFGNLKAIAYGDKGELRVEKYNSGVFGSDGKEIALKDQMAIAYKHRHGIVVTLAKAFVVVRTSAS